ncbi:MAG TPA: hypothetical protein VLJ76_08120, partial [Gaiellaceae bacterium]|nr:hypothetical protein [Gaiellaceae bacterium]
MRFLFRGRVMVGAVVVVVVGLAAGGIAYASIPDSSGAIHGCFARSAAPGAQPGALRVIDTA